MSLGLNFMPQPKQNDNYLLLDSIFLVRMMTGSLNLVDATSSLGTCPVWLLSPLEKIFQVFCWTVNQDGFKPNLETHLNPLLATKHDDASSDSKDKNNSSHHPLLMQILSDELGCKVDDLANIELNICDAQPSCLGGANNEFIFSGRLDNLASSFLCTQSSC
ncbi:hypothetical protein L1987_34923 [Smallanthus sonchifolius]|uniref:Uncharacterized protein n=1 Tax=Smallanthus sonchifolius TaxID=185202 RepID=A0ACB9HV66_9ASTR|nr:hypothetical protein L1987_34923 [Smallanthus sonchifolius]